MKVSVSSSESGFAAAEWVVALGLIVLPMVMIVGSIAPWLARQTMGREISQEAARSVVLAADWETGGFAASTVAEAIVANYGLTAEDWDLVSIRTEPDGAVFGRGADVVVEVRVRVPALTIPGVGSVAEVWWHTTHVEHVDDFRSFP
jgi:hypothetical protein